MDINVEKLLNKHPDFTVYTNVDVIIGKAGEFRKRVINTKANIAGITKSKLLQK